MTSSSHYIPQSDPPLPPWETLPTMYDLPSDNPEEPGLPDDFHFLQPLLLYLTFQPINWNPELVYSAADLNLYYTIEHPLWYKRPDWFGVVGAGKLYKGQDLRLSYVTWQEPANPFVVVELLSPGTEEEDLGIKKSATDKPPSKWEVYEQILRIPYYVVFSRYTNRLRVFELEGGHYLELELSESRVWMSDLNLGLGVWQGEFLGVDRLWLRWYDIEGNWILTPEERERQRAEQAEAQLESLIQRLRESGIDPDPFLNG